MVQGSGQRAVGVTLIAVMKLVKVMVLVAVGTAALIVEDRVPPETLTAWANAVAPSNHWVHVLLAKVSGASEKQLTLVSVGSFAYAAVFSVEGLGLWLQKTWAEYLTIVVTTSFIPLELYELTKHFSLGKVATTVLNVVAVIYLIARRLAHKRHRQAT